MFPLGLLSTGERAEIVRLRNSEAHGPDGKDCGCRMEDMGLRVGKTVEVLANGGHGPVLVKVDESRIALGRGMAMKIMVIKDA